MPVSRPRRVARTPLSCCRRPLEPPQRLLDGLAGEGVSFCQSPEDLHDDQVLLLGHGNDWPPWAHLKPQPQAAQRQHRLLPAERCPHGQEKEEDGRRMKRRLLLAEKPEEDKAPVQPGESVVEDTLMRLSPLVTSALRSVHSVLGLGHCHVLAPHVQL